MPLTCALTAAANWVVHFVGPSHHPVCSSVPFQSTTNAVGRDPGRRAGFCLEEGRRWVVLSYGRGARNKWAAVAAIVTTKQGDATAGSGSIACRGSLGGLTDRGSTPRNHHTGRWFSGIPTQYRRVTLRGALRVPRQGRTEVWLCRNPSGVKKKQSPRPPPPIKPFLTPPNRRGFDRSWAASWLHG